MRRSRFASTLSLLGPAVLFLAGLPAPGCSSRDRSEAAGDGPGAPRVALIGWDGATWEVIDPMLREGRLPNLARLTERGCRGVLVAEPPLLSPALWTTLATGFPPAEHGITGFELPRPDGEGVVLAATFHRRRAPLWRMASDHGLEVGFVGWWTTWPAEPVRGFMVSDHLAYNRWDAWVERADLGEDRLTFPPELAQELDAARVRPERIDPDELTAIVPFGAEERREMMEATRPIKFHAPSVFRFAYATDASNAGFARQLLATRGQPDLFGVVFVLTDVAGHVFWHHHHPERFGVVGPDTHLRQAVPNVYEQLDRWTGEILDRLDSRTYVVLLSDHGMGATGSLPTPERNPAGDHAPDGILIVSGPGVPHGADVGRFGALDLAPTVLALLDLPLADDMPGRAIEAVLPAGRLGRRSRIASYGPGGIDGSSDRSPADEAYLERLRSLGYVR